MLLFKSSLIILLLSQASFALLFTPRVCLMSSFETEIKHEGKFFGLIKNQLNIKKEECNIEINYKKILDTRWKIDICREPVHVKVLSKGSLEVFKRKDDCTNSNDEFCKSWRELEMILQDHGLIFAKGERESLETSHGKTYCTYLLLKKYLKSGILFSKYKNPIDIFSETEQTKSTQKMTNNSDDENVSENDDKMNGAQKESEGETKARF